MDKLHIEAPVKYNHLAHELKGEDGMDINKVNALFSLGIDLALSWRRDDQFGLVCYKERTRGYLH